MTIKLPEHLHDIVETICQAGCTRVNQIIESLESETHTEETCDLSTEECQQVLHELKNIMSVYERSI